MQDRIEVDMEVVAVQVEIEVVVEDLGDVVVQEEIEEAEGVEDVEVLQRPSDMNMTQDVFPVRWNIQMSVPVGTNRTFQHIQTNRTTSRPLCRIRMKPLEQWQNKDYMY